jgi:hypothetical protein
MSARMGRLPVALLIAALFAACDRNPVGLPEATTVEVEPGRLEMVAGDLATVTAHVLDASGRPMRGTTVGWTSDRPSTARVTPDGTVTAVAPGSATLVATYGTIRTEVPVTVVRDDRDVIRQIELERESISIDRRAGTQAVSFAAYDGRGRLRCDVPLTIAMSDRSVATVSHSGCRLLILPLGPGQSTVTVSAGEATTEMALRVTLGSGHAAFFSARPEVSDLVAGGTVSYAVRVIDGDGAPRAGHTVNFDVSVGGLVSASVATDAEGIARVGWRLPTVLRSRGMSDDSDFGTITFRTQLPDGTVETASVSERISPAAAATVSFRYVIGSWTAYGPAPAPAPEVLQVPLFRTVLAVAEARDAYGNRRDPSTLVLTREGSSIFQSIYLLDRNYAGVAVSVGTPQTWHLIARDGAAEARLTIDFFAP